MNLKILFFFFITFYPSFSIELNLLENELVKKVKAYDSAEYHYLDKDEQTELKRTENKTITMGLPNYGGNSNIRIDGIKLYILNRNLLILLIFFMFVLIKLLLNKKTIKKQNDKLYHLLHYDQEVNCRNRTSYKIDIDKAVDQRLKGAIIVFDIDGLYNLSHLYGYELLDKAMNKGVTTTEKLLNDKGKIYKVSKGEFAVIIPDISKADSKILSKNLLKKLTKLNIISQEDHSSVKIIMGVAHTGDEKNMIDASKEATMARYLAKISKSTNFIMADDDITDRFKQEISMEEDLKTALRRREFIPYFQLRTNMKTGKVAGCETLARWISKDRGFLSPASFIPLAETTGQIFQLDLQIMEKSIAQLKKWITKGIVDDDFKMSVNLSIKSVQRDSIIEDVRYLLEKYDLDPKFLEVELTETVFGEDPRKVKDNLKGLKKLGLTLALDDFSVGHSSTKHLLDFSFDVMKLDMSLLPINESEVSKKKVYKTLVEMSKNLGLTSVGEGVETKYQEQLLIEVGVTEGQGYYYSKPLSAEDIEGVLKSR